MSELNFENCPHERRPGTTVCLHCRYAARQAARDAQRRRFAGWLSIVVAVIIVGGIGIYAAAHAADIRIGETASRIGTGIVDGLASIRLDIDRYINSAQATTRSEARRTAARDARMAPRESVTTFILAADTTGVLPGTLASADPVPDEATATSPASDTLVNAAIPPVWTVIPEGRTELDGGMFAVRNADTIKVHFDTELGRTRRPEKFERIVRSTLPELYGPAVDSLLAAIPAGGLTREGDLVNELPARGVRLALGAGWSLALWPETRPGRDGPIVVTYRALVAR